MPNNWQKNASGQLRHVQATGPSPRGAHPAPTQVAPPRKAAGPVPVQVLGAFYQRLPSPSLQQFAFAVEADYSSFLADYLTDGSLSTSSGLFRVPASTIYVFTDVLFYATVPSADLQGPEERLDAVALSGSIQFQLLFGGQIPFRVTHRPAPLYNDGLGTALSTDAPGWGLLDTPMGVQRTAAFAVYARGGVPIETRFYMADVTFAPRFIIHKLGVQVHGFGLPEPEFAKIWEGANRGA